MSFLRYKRLSHKLYMFIVHLCDLVHSLCMYIGMYYQEVCQYFLCIFKVSPKCTVFVFMYG